MQEANWPSAASMLGYKSGLGSGKAEPDEEFMLDRESIWFTLTLAFY